MEIIYITIGIIWLHTFGDFLLQTREMAENKSSSLYWLTLHVGLYSLPFVLLLGFWYGVINFVLHFMVDFVSSRVGKWAYERNRNKLFWCGIGVDQALHLTCLLLTLPLATMPVLP